MENHKPTIKAFFLADPLNWVANSDSLKWVILKAMQPNVPPALARPVNSGIDFHVDALCGHMHCNLYHDLWHENYKVNVVNLNDLEAGRAKAEMEAKRFLHRLGSECEKKEYLNLGIPAILPPVQNIILKDIYLVPHHSKPWIDHWLLRFLVHLPASIKGITHKDANSAVAANDTIPVMGSNIDIRIGNNFKVTGFESFWRPTNLDFKEVEILELDHEVLESAGGHTHGPSDHKQEHKTCLVYLLDGAQSPQNILAPYYLKQDGHASFFFPASNHSLEIDFFQEYAGENIVNVHASVTGGSGDYSFHWSGYSVSEGDWHKNPVQLLGGGMVTSFDEEKNIPAATAIKLKKGVYNLVLIAGDNKTGVVKQKQIMVYTNTVQSTVNNMA